MFEKLREIIESYNSIVIYGHPNPDGDCYGSQLALREGIKLNYPNKKVYATGTGLRRFRNTLGKMDDVSDETISESLAILVDGNDLYRMEDQRVWNAKAWIKIDHHIDTGHYTQGEYVLDEDADSTCSLIVKMFQECGWKMNSNIASLLFLGILTDTGRFQYIRDFVEAFDQASWLCQMGAEPRPIYTALNRTPEMSLVFKGYVFSHYKKTEAGVIYLELDKETIARFKLTAARAGNMVNLISNIEGYPIWVFITETEEGFSHIEFRSNGPEVQALAASIGGGGHKYASGVTLPEFNEKTTKMVIDLCDKALLEWKKEGN